jgi:hypothetical protein
VYYLPHPHGFSKLAVLQLFLFVPYYSSFLLSLIEVRYGVSFAFVFLELGKLVLVTL